MSIMAYFVFSFCFLLEKGKRPPQNPYRLLFNVAHNKIINNIIYKLITHKCVCMYFFSINQCPFQMTLEYNFFMAASGVLYNILLYLIFCLFII